MGKNSIIRPFFFFAQRAKKGLAAGPSPPQELEVGLRSGLYLLVIIKHCENRKTMPREHRIGCQGLKMFLLKDPLNLFFLS